MSAGAAASPDSYFPKGELRIIRDNNDVSGSHFQKRSQIQHRFPTEVHECLWFQNNHILAIQSAPAEYGLLFFYIQIDRILPGKPIDNHKPNIVSVVLILRARIS